MSRLRKPVPNAFGYPSGTPEYEDEGESRARKRLGRVHPARAFDAPVIRIAHTEDRPMDSDIKATIRVQRADGTWEPAAIMKQETVEIAPCQTCGGERSIVESDRREDGSFSAEWVCPDCEPERVAMPSAPGGVVIDVTRNDDGTFNVKRRDDA